MNLAIGVVDGEVTAVNVVVDINVGINIVIAIPLEIDVIDLSQQVACD